MNTKITLKINHRRWLAIWSYSLLFLVTFLPSLGFVFMLEDYVPSFVWQNVGTHFYWWTMRMPIILLPTFSIVNGALMALCVYQIIVNARKIHKRKLRLDFWEKRFTS